MRKRHSAEQIAQALRQAEAGTPISEITRKMGVHEHVPSGRIKTSELHYKHLGAVVD